MSYVDNMAILEAGSGNNRAFAALPRQKELVYVDRQVNVPSSTPNHTSKGTCRCCIVCLLLVAGVIGAAVAVGVAIHKAKEAYKYY